MLVVFLSAFHLLGGGVMGQAFRAAQRGSSHTFFYLVWGALMGVVPLVFDWFFLIAQGYLIHGLVGPALFIVTTLASAFLELKVDGAAMISATLGSVGFLLGILSVPLMLDVTKTRTVGMEDYVFGSCFVLLFVVIGGAFAWNGFRSIFRGVPLDALYAEREQKPSRRQNRKKDSR